MDTYHVHANSNFGAGEDILVEVDALVANASDRLTALQEPDGHLRFDLEADATIPSEYIFSITSSMTLSRNLKKSWPATSVRCRAITAAGPCFMKVTSIFPPA